METVVNDPVDRRRGVAFIAHPHPLHGGSLDNKVVQTLAKTAYGLGMVVVRPNFRGVGQSEGEYDRGAGETADMLEIIRFVMGHYADLPIYLAGFSFGAFVQHRVAAHMPHQRLLLVAPAVNLYPFQPVASTTLLIHGEHDELVAVDQVKRFADACGASLAVIPGADHYFHKKLKDLAAVVENAWRC